GANTAIYSIVDASMLRALPVPTPERLVTLATSAPEQQTFSYPLYLQFREATGNLARFALFTPSNRVEAKVARENGPVEMVTQQFVTGEAFETLGVGPALGRVFSEEEDRGPGGAPVAVLSYDYWRRHLGSDPAVLYRTIQLD